MCNRGPHLGFVPRLWQIDAAPHRPVLPPLSQLCWLCGRQIFVERFASDVLAPSARRTGRLDCIVHHLGLALGGRPAASFARRLMLPVSNDTLLRVVRRRADVPAEPLNVIGIDDWAWRRNHRYGTIVCDLERRRPVSYCRIVSRQRL
jgi:hypothetical protein